MTNDFTKREDTATESNLSTADLAQSAETANERREETLRESRESILPPRNSSRSETPAGPPSTTQTASASAGAATGAGTAGAGVARARQEEERKEEEMGPLFAPDEAKTFRSQWENVQVGFVDEPRRAVEQADHLVAEAIKRIAEIFADEREKLERQWDRGENVSTEDLRLGLRRYRTFFERLLAI